MARSERFRELVYVIAAGERHVKYQGSRLPGNLLHSEYQETIVSMQKGKIELVC